jgi:plastocyanin
MARAVRGGMALLLVGALTSAALIVALPEGARGARARFVGACNPTCVWQPRLRRIRTGDRIIWAAGDRVHTVAARRGIGRRWRMFVRLDPGERTSRVFRRRGTYYFECTLHPGMRGRVRVRAR